MKSLLSLAALVGGIWLIHLGFERQRSIAGSADASLSRLGQRIDGGTRAPTHVRYYVAGAALVVGGAFGLGILRK